MRSFNKVEQLYRIEGKVYSMDLNDKKISIGTILYDSRKTEFVAIETEKDCKDYAFVAPELYGIMKEVDPIIKI